jgi:hypothetical protein
VRYELNSYILFRRNSVFEGLFSLLDRGDLWTVSSGLRYPEGQFFGSAVRFLSYKCSWVIFANYWFKWCCFHTHTRRVNDSPRRGTTPRREEGGWASAQILNTVVTNSVTWNRESNPGQQPGCEKKIRQFSRDGCSPINCSENTWLSLSCPWTRVRYWDRVPLGAMDRASRIQAKRGHTCVHIVFIHTILSVMKLALYRPLITSRLNTETKEITSDTGEFYRLGYNAV